MTSKISKGRLRSEEINARPLTKREEIFIVKCDKRKSKKCIYCRSVGYCNLKKCMVTK